MASSVAIGLVTLLTPRQVWVPVVFGILGACLLLAGSIVLILEAQKAVRTLAVETAFLGKLVNVHYNKRVTPG